MLSHFIYQKKIIYKIIDLHIFEIGPLQISGGNPGSLFNLNSSVIPNTSEYTTVTSFMHFSGYDDF